MQDKTPPDQAVDVADEPLKSDGQPGQLLRQTREAADMSIDDVAHALRLEADVLLAIEADDYEGLGAAVFVRGYLRSYARYLELDEEQVLAGLEMPEPEPEEFKTLSTHTEIKLGTNMANFALWALVGVVVLIGIVYIAIGDDPSQEEALQKGEFVVPVDEPKSVEPGPVEPVEPLMQPEEAVAESLPSEEAAAEILSEPEPELEPEPEPEPEPEYELVLNFSDECWVEVSDADSRLLYGLEKPGISRTIVGRPPFRLFLGNVSGVSLVLDGQEFSVPLGALTGSDTARFTINEADIPGAEE